MASAGLNAVRTYSIPPRWLLDAAARHGLRVLVGLPWEQHVAFLEDRGRARSIRERLRSGVLACAGHAAVLAFAVGNEIPAGIVRWHGRRNVERFLRSLYETAKEADPDALVTYVNYPSTEYLELPFLDLVCFNVYLESRPTLEAYLARLQNVAGDQPLVMTEIGLDSRRNGEEAQARSLDWQVRAAFAGGCAGAFVFAWTDEWHRGGADIEDWDFGITRRDRTPKPAHGAVRCAFAEAPFASGVAWPRISVVVCTYNGSRTLRDCLEGMQRLDYPDFEVIVVDDGSTDASAEIARGFGVRVISTPNRGLSSARNTGCEAATGEIVAYTDDDARPDPDWLHYLAATYEAGGFAAVGGPTIAPPGDGRVAGCVARAPGGPVHVLITDTTAEHVPGCNMSFRKRCLVELGGFDPRFRAAGDDVDMCWRLLDRGWTIGFSPSAMVWHHHRNSLRAYWRQQVGYGKAESLLEGKWPERYNPLGHLAWAGRIYSDRITRALRLPSGSVYGGVWGTAPFQRLYEREPATILSLALMPEWNLGTAALAALALLGLSWRPLLALTPLALLAAALPVAQAAASVARAVFNERPRSWGDGAVRYALTFCLHLLQPLARLKGRLDYGLTPWRRRGAAGFAGPGWRPEPLWLGQGRPPETWLEEIEHGLKGAGAITRRGGPFDDWDLEVRGGLLGGSRLRLAVEEHGQGRQLGRLACSPHYGRLGLWIACGLAVLAALAGRDRAFFAGIALALASGGIAAAALLDAAAARATIRRSVDGLRASQPAHTSE